ncbi:hypothetical protein F4861DRAFT_507709 [Xylaria intraflava]|nr:hypothetical protein F4861DRAFT_507709 [Xylaria intraflava]
MASSISLDELPSLPPAEQQEILNSAALRPPDGKESNFTNPENNNGLAFGIAILSITVSTLLLIIRTYTRVFLFKKFRLEDVFGWLAFTGYVGYMYTVFRYLYNIGYFVNQWNVQVKTLSEFNKVITIGGSFYSGNMLFIKIAILLDWLHMFVPGKTRNAFFWACWAVLSVNTLYYIAAIVAINLTCIPLEAWWNFFVHGHCLNQKAVDTSAAAADLVSDLAILGLAQKVIWNLQMSIKKKLGLSFIFAAGIFGIICALSRLIVTIFYQNEADETFAASSVILWGVGEMTSAFLVFCEPAFPKAIGSFVNGIAHVKNYASRSQNSWKQSKQLSINRSDSQRPSELGLARPHDHKAYLRDVPMMTFSTNVPQRSDSTEHLTARPSNGILRTTRVVTAVDDDIENQGARFTHSRQHPWIIAE